MTAKKLDPVTCYAGLRYNAPDVVRLVRAALDNGITVDDLIKRHCRKPSTAIFSGERLAVAILFMAANPHVGCARLISGDFNSGGQWDWEDESGTGPLYGYPSELSKAAQRRVAKGPVVEDAALFTD